MIAPETCIFEMTIRVSSGNRIEFSSVAADGAVVLNEDVSRYLRFIRAEVQKTPDSRVPTMSERALDEAPPVLPEGWKETLDGYAQTFVDGVATNARTYRRLADDLVLEAPCGPTGEVTMGTLAALEKAPRLVIVGE